MRHVHLDLPDYIRGALTRDRAKAILLHLDGCTLCREEERKLRVVFAELDQKHSAPPPPEYFVTLLPRLRERQASFSKPLSIWSPLVTKLVMPVAVALVVIVGLARLSVDSDSPPLASLNPDDVIEALAESSEQNLFMTLTHDIGGMLLDRTLATALAQDLLTNGTMSFSHFSTEVLLMELSENDVDVVLQQMSERKIL
jgi:hypothetical protein